MKYNRPENCGFSIRFAFILNAILCLVVLEGANGAPDEHSHYTDRTVLECVYPGQTARTPFDAYTQSGSEAETLTAAFLLQTLFSSHDIALRLFENRVLNRLHAPGTDASRRHPCILISRKFNIPHQSSEETPPLFC